jgi:hypothetical protein
MPVDIPARSTAADCARTNARDGAIADVQTLGRPRMEGLGLPPADPRGERLRPLQCVGEGTNRPQQRGAYSVQTSRREPLLIT